MLVPLRLHSHQLLFGEHFFLSHYSEVTFHFLQIFGILVLLLAILLIQYKKGGYKFDVAVFYIFASSAFFAIFQVTSAQLAKTLSAGTYLPIAYVGSTLIVVMLYWKKSREIS